MRRSRPNRPTIFLLALILVAIPLAAQESPPGGNAGGQVDAIPFNPGMLSSEMQISYMSDLVTRIDLWDLPDSSDFELDVLMDVDEYEKNGGVLPDEELRYVESMGQIGKPDDTRRRRAVTIVGSFRCTGFAHNPHKGTTTGTVKAKANANCVYTPRITFLSPPIIRWNLNMTLVGVGIGSWYGSFPQWGWSAEWKADAGGFGTQVDTGRCVNGTYWNIVGVWVWIPRPWFIVSGSPLVGTSARKGIVVSCPQ